MKYTDSEIKNYILKNGDIKDVPKEFITQELCNFYIEKGGELKDIPREFITQEMCNKYMEIKMFFYYNENLEYIPEQFLTQEICNIFIKKGGTLRFVPKPFITQEMCNTYIEKGGDFEDIPEEYLTEDICNAYIKKGGTIIKVPEEFITQEMCNTYIEEYTEDSSDYIFLKNVPEKFRTQELYNIYFLKSRSLDKIPKEFITQEMRNKYFEICGRLEKIPKQYWTTDMIVAYIRKDGDFDIIPKKLLTQEICNIYFENYGYVNKIPTKYWTQEMAEEYLFCEDGDIEKVPRKFLTQEICDDYFKNNGSIIGIPEKFITKKMCDESLLRESSYYNLPDKVKSLIAKTIMKNNYSLNKYNYYITRGILIRIILNTPVSKLSKRELEEKYNVDENMINNTLKYIKEEDEEKYLKIKKAFEEKEKELTQECYDFADQVNDIIKSLGTISNKNSKERSNLTRKQRIQFSYLLGKIKSNVDIYDAYEVINTKKNKYSNFINFCNKELGFIYKNPLKEIMKMLNKDESFNKYGYDWLGKFNENMFFEDMVGDKVGRFYRDKNGNTVELKEPEVYLVLNYLKMKKIPCIDCIVKEAIRNYVNGELENFADDLIKGNYLKDENKKTTDNKDNTL